MRSLIARFMGPTWDPSGADRSQVGPMNFAIWDMPQLWDLLIVYSLQCQEHVCTSLSSIVNNVEELVRWGWGGVLIIDIHFVKFYLSNVSNCRDPAFYQRISQILSHGAIKFRSSTLIARCVGPTRGPSMADRTQVGPMVAPWTLLSGYVLIHPPPPLNKMSPFWQTTNSNAF